MQLNNIARPRGAVKKTKIRGRGRGSGHGKTSCRGHNGQLSRAGHHFYPGFEGGQSPLIRRIPKRGFRSKSKQRYDIVNLDELKKVKRADTITPLELSEAGLIRNKNSKVKILGDGELKRALTIKAHYFSESALKKISQINGKAEIIT